MHWATAKPAKQDSEVYMLNVQVKYYPERVKLLSKLGKGKKQILYQSGANLMQ